MASGLSVVSIPECHDKGEHNPEGAGTRTSSSRTFTIAGAKADVMPDRTFGLHDD